MRNKITTIILSAYLLFASSILAEEGYQVPVWTINNGGVKSSSEHYTATATLGEIDAPVKLKSQIYTLQGGFLSTAQEDTNICIVPILYLLLN